MANIVSIDGIPVYQALVDSEDTGMLRISLVDDPAVQSNFLAFKAEKKALSYAIQDEDKRLVLGVVMRADFPIYRRDEDGFEYYIIYRADTIRKMAEKYLADSRQNAVDLMHDGEEVKGVQMVQYFIKGKGLAPDGFGDDIADGTLFAEFHITDDGIWDAVKAGTYRGFSLEGLFDLRPERDEAAVQEIVDNLDGRFNEQTQPKYTKNIMTKLKGLLARIARELVQFGNTTTDKGIIAWDGEEDLKEGDAVYIEDGQGGRTPAADGDYRTDDSKVIVVVDGKVAEIKDDAAEVAPEQEQAEEPAEETEPAKMASKDTDKGVLVWDGEEDLKAGDAVFVYSEDGDRTPAPDGDYTTEDGKVITVADGVVTEIKDAEAEVAPEVTARKQEVMSRKQKYEASYNEKTSAIAIAVGQVAGEDEFAYIIDAGDNYCIASLWNEETWTETVYRFDVTWDGDTPTVSNQQEVKMMWVPLDFVSPFETAAEPEEMARLRQENEELRQEVESLKAQPAAEPAHTEFESTGAPAKTGNKGLDRLAALLKA